MKNLFFSSDGTIVTCWARNANTWAKVVNGQIVQRLTKITPRFLQSGHIVYLQQEGNLTRAVIDGTPDPKAYESILYFDTSFFDSPFSRNGVHYAYAGYTGGKFYAIVDGVQREPAYDVINDMAFSKDGAHLALMTERKGQPYLVIDGIEQEAVACGFSLLFSPDGKRIVYQIMKADRYHLVVDGIPSAKSYQQIMPEFSPDGNHILCRVRDTDGWRILLDGVEWPAGDSITEHAFSPDGTHAASIIVKGGKRNIIVDGKLESTLTNNEPLEFFFSEDNTVHGYSVHTRQGVMATVNGTPVAPPKELVGNGEIQRIFPVSSDGKHLCYILYQEGWMRSILDGRLLETSRVIPCDPFPAKDVPCYAIGNQDSYTLVIGTWRSPEYQAIYAHYPSDRFLIRDAPNRYHFFVNKNEVDYRVDLAIE